MAVDVTLFLPYITSHLSGCKDTVHSVPNGSKNIAFIKFRWTQVIQCSQQNILFLWAVAMEAVYKALMLDVDRVLPEVFVDFYAFLQNQQADGNRMMWKFRS